MYSACIKCAKLGTICKGPNFTDMSVLELIDWIKARKAHLGWTSQALADRSSIPEGTIKRVLASKGGTFQYDTIAPLLQALTGSSRAELPCPDPDGSIEERLTARVRHLEQELADTKSLAAQAQENAARSEAAHCESEAHLRGQTKNLRKALSLITVILFVVLLAIIAALIYDVANPHIGYFRG